MSWLAICGLVTVGNYVAFRRFRERGTRASVPPVKHRPLVVDFGLLALAPLVPYVLFRVTFGSDDGPFSFRLAALWLSVHAFVALVLRGPLLRSRWPVALAYSLVFAFTNGMVVAGPIVSTSFVDSPFALLLCFAVAVAGASISLSVLRWLPILWAPTARRVLLGGAGLVLTLGVVAIASILTGDTAEPPMSFARAVLLTEPGAPPVEMSVEVFARQHRRAHWNPYEDPSWVEIDLKVKELPRDRSIRWALLLAGDRWLSRIDLPVNASMRIVDGVWVVKGLMPGGEEGVAIEGTAARSFVTASLGRERGRFPRFGAYDGLPSAGSVMEAVEGLQRPERFKVDVEVTSRLERFTFESFSAGLVDQAHLWWSSTESVRPDYTIRDPILYDQRGTAMTILLSAVAVLLTLNGRVTQVVRRYIDGPPWLPVGVQSQLRSRSSLPA